MQKFLRGIWHGIKPTVYERSRHATILLMWVLVDFKVFAPPGSCVSGINLLPLRSNPPFFQILEPDCKLYFPSSHCETPPPGDPGVTPRGWKRWWGFFGCSALKWTREHPGIPAAGSGGTPALRWQVLSTLFLSHCNCRGHVLVASHLSLRSESQLGGVGLLTFPSIWGR